MKGGLREMVILLEISRHAAADCPLNNERVREATIAGMSKVEELAKKHGVKMVGGWNVHSEHLVVDVFEAPSLEAFEAFSMEPEIMNMNSWYTTEVKVALTLEETMQMMMQAQ
jgi:uncharacterized protein with GYD domain